MRTALAGRRRLVVLAAVALAALGAGIGFAAVPDSSGVVHACFAKRDGALRVIDTDAGGACNTSKETPLDWNRTGPQGATGAQGASGPQGATGPAGPGARTIEVDVHDDDQPYRIGYGGIAYIFECLPGGPIMMMEPAVPPGRVQLSADGMHLANIVAWDQDGTTAQITGDEGLFTVHGIIRVTDAFTDRGGAYTHLDFVGTRSDEGAAGGLCSFSGMLFGSNAS